MTAIPQLPARFSYSSASRYRQCPLSWRFKYVERLPDPAGPPAVIGSFVHGCLEHFYQQPGAKRTEDTLRDIAGRLWRTKNVAAELAAVGGDDERTSKRDAWGLLRGLWEVEDPTGVAVVSTEERVTVNLAGVPLLAIIDRVEHVDGSQVVAADYKSGKLPDRRYHNSHVDQVHLYAAAKAAAGVGVDAVSVIYLKGQVVREASTPDTKAEAAEALACTWEQLIDSVEADHFEARPGPLCGWCPFIAHCPAGQEEVAERVAAGKMRSDAPALEILETVAAE